MQVISSWVCICFFFNDTATTEIYTLSLHDALPISIRSKVSPAASSTPWSARVWRAAQPQSWRRISARRCGARSPDRESTRLNSRHANISYAVFFLKKKKNRLAHTYNDSNTDHHTYQ